MSSYKFEIFADYHQFYLEDENAHGDLSDEWTDEAVERNLAVANGCVSVGTFRNSTVPVSVELLSQEPDDDRAAWDAVTECSLVVAGQNIVIAGCTSYYPDASRIPVQPDTYRVRVSYGGRVTISANGLDGNDKYRVQLWPGSPIEPRVVKGVVPN